MYNENRKYPSEILKILGARFKEFRLRMEFTQAEISEQAGVSIPTIYKFENGRLSDITMSNLLKLLNCIQLESTWEKLIPDLPESPYMYKASKKKQRVRHSK